VLGDISDTDQYKEHILEELKKPSIKSFNNIRQLIADSDVNPNQFEEIYSFLYEHLDTYANGNQGLIICIIEENLYHSYFCIDKEISFICCVSRILECILNKKLIKG
jgi:hypothetical protein